MSLTAKKIPNDWKLKKLKDVSTFSNGKGHEQTIDENGQYIVVNSKFISTDGRVKKFSNQNLSPLNIGDITMVMSDIPNGKAIAKCFIIDKENRYTLNQRIGSIKSSKDCDNKFLYYIINRNTYYLAMDNGVSQTNFRKDEVLACPIPLPPLPEQQKIAEILSTVDAKIEVIDQQITQTQELKKGLMQRLLSKGIGHTEFKDSPLGKIPKSWEVVDWESIGIELIDGDRGTNYPKSTDFSNIGHCLFLSAKNVTKNGFKFQECQFIDEKRDKLLRKGKLSRFDFVITTRGSVGHIAFYDDLVPFEHIRLNSGMVILRDNTSKYNHEFLYQFMKSPVFESQIEFITSGSAQPQLTIGGLKKVKIPILPLSEQLTIGAFLKETSNKLEVLAEKKVYYQELKQGLMQQLLTGKIRVSI
jgi:type I restriction enzyme S subunit